MRYLGREQIDELLATLRTNKLRTALTGFAVGWGILLLVLLLSAGAGFGNGVRASLQSIGFNGESVEFRVGWIQLPINGHKQWGTPKVTEGDMNFLVASNPRSIKWATPVNHAYNLKVEANGILVEARASGVRKEYGEIQRLKLLVPTSRFINDKDERESRKVVVVSDMLATELFGDKDKALGSKILINKVGFTIVGVCKAYYGKWTPMIMPLSTMRLLRLGADAYTPDALAEIQMLCPGIRTEQQVDSLRRVLTRQLAPRLGTSPEDEGIVQLSSQAASNATIGTILVGIDVFLWIVGLSTLVIGLVGVINIMQITITERKRELGVRKALGAQPRDIIAMILSESVVITLVSGLIGLVSGVGIMLVVDYYITTMGIGDLSSRGEEMNGTLYQHPMISLTTAVGTLLVMLLGGLIAGYLPARKAVRLSAVEAMRN